MWVWQITLWSFSLYLSASSSLAIFLLASVLSVSASLWIAKTWAREQEKEGGGGGKWVQQQTPSNITQQNSPACDLVHLVSSFLSITPSKVPSEPMCLHKGPLPWMYGRHMDSRVSFTTREEWKEESFQGKQNGKWTTDSLSFIVFISYHLADGRRKKMRGGKKDAGWTE